MSIVYIQELDTIDLDLLEGESQPPETYAAQKLPTLNKADIRIECLKLSWSGIRRLLRLPTHLLDKDLRDKQFKCWELLASHDFKIDEMTYAASKTKEVARDHLAALLDIRNKNPQLYRLRDRAVIDITPDA